MIDEKEIRNLIKLLDDPDHQVYEAVKSKLNNIGVDVVKLLEEAWENSLDGLFQTRIENITKEIQFEDVRKQLKQWTEQGGEDLLEGALIIEKYQYPDFDKVKVINQIELIKKDIWLELNSQLTALEKTKIINHIIFEVHGFARSSSFQSSPQSHFMNHLLQTKKGSPFSLAILFASIAQSLELPIYGVSLPKNFILCYKDNTTDAFKQQVENEVLFYINPFNKGVVFGNKEVELFIKQQKLENKKAYFTPCSNKETIISYVNTLIEFYKSNSDKTKVEDYEMLLKILYF